MAEDDLLGGRYQRGESLGAGGMGEVWAAQDQLLGRRVAVKQLRVHGGLDGRAVERMVREARVAARLHHPHVVSVFDLVFSEGQPFLVMEFVAGESLAQRLEREGTLTGPETARIGGLVASALAAADRVGIVHRDVKPANVLLGTDGSVKLADFGIARGLGDLALTDTGQMLGTVAYMAPEVARTGAATAASDVWSLGATLHACLQGHAPHAGGEPVGVTTILARLLTDEVVEPPRAGALGPVLMAALDTDPARRPSAAEASSRLLALVTAPVPGAAPPTRLERVPGPAPRADGPPHHVEPGPPVVHRTVAAGAVITAPVPPDHGRSRGLVVASAAASVLALGGVAALVVWVLLGQQQDTSAAAPAAGATSTTTTAVPTTQVPPTAGASTTTSTVPVRTEQATTVPPSPSTSTAPTTVTVAVGGVSGTDRQGFAVDGARCNADDPAVFAGYTAESMIVVCLTGDDRYYYKGVRTTDGAGIELDDPVPTAVGFTATNGATTYDLGADGFTISGSAGPLSYQPWIERTAP